MDGAVFLDIRKAFDSINHNILLHKLKDQFRITNIELGWFESYLTNRERVLLTTPRHRQKGLFAVFHKDQF
jgi:hypothetical protein